MADSNWYTAVLVMTSEIVGATDDEPLVDLQLRVLWAGDSQSAYSRSLDIGRAQEKSYANECGETVKWTFAGVHELIELEGSPTDGVEIYSRLTREEPGSLVPPKDELQVFAIQKYEHLSAEELLKRVEGVARQDD